MLWLFVTRGNELSVMKFTVLALKTVKSASLRRKDAVRVLHAA